MNMRMVRRVMERTVPFQVFNLYTMCFGDLVHITSDELFPRFGVVKMQTLRVLAAQTDYLCPDNAVMVGNSFCYRESRAFQRPGAWKYS